MTSCCYRNFLFLLFLEKDDDDCVLDDTNHQCMVNNELEELTSGHCHGRRQEVDGWTFVF